MKISSIKNRKHGKTGTNEYQLEQNQKIRYELYNTSKEEIDLLYKKQNFKCAICFKKESKDKLLPIDHCHETGRVRGLLCHLCNLGLGAFKDNSKLLLSANEYLLGKNYQSTLDRLKKMIKEE